MQDESQAAAAATLPEATTPAGFDHQAASMEPAPAESMAMPFDITLRDGRRVAPKVIASSVDAVATLNEALATKDVADGAIVAWRGGSRARLVALRFVRPAGEPPVGAEDVSSLFVDAAPSPAVGWAHEDGLSVIFAEVPDATARELAGVWMILAPLGRLAGWNVQVMNEVRHPESRGGGRAQGPLRRMTPAVGAWVMADSSDVAGDIGCASDDVAALCERADVSSWRAAARALVHFPHQRLVLAAHHPHLPTELAQPAWRCMLRVANADRLSEPEEEKRADWVARIDRAASAQLDIVRSSNGSWLDAATLLPRPVSATRTLAFLPSVFSPPEIDRAAASGPLPGFTPVAPLGALEVIGPYVPPPRGAVFAVRPRAFDDPPRVDLSVRPSAAAVERAWSTIEAALPGVCRGYLSALIACVFVGQRGVGLPPMICATGQTGGAKTGHIILASGMVGTTATAIGLGPSDDSTRKIGLALEDGSRLLYIDEIGRVRNVDEKLEPILGANSKLRFRAKFANERTAPMRAAVILLGSTLPHVIVHSPEVSRRSVGYRLAGAHKDWSLLDPQTGSPLDLSQCRHVPDLRVALDVVTADMWWRVFGIGPAGNWRKLLMGDFEAMDLAELDLASDPEAHARAIVDLYEYYRLAQAKDLSRMEGWSGWLLADPGSRVAAKLEVLVDMNASSRVFKAQTADLERQNLAPILGFAEPQLQLLVHRRGQRVIVKFVQVGVLKGRGIAREKLPPAVPTPKQH